MKFTHIISGVALASAMLLFATSCDSKLDIQQHSVSSIDSYYSTDAEAEEAIIAVYAQYRSCNTGFLCLQTLKNYMSDDVYSGGGSHYDGNYYQLSDFTFSSDYSNIKTIYTALYTLIYRANVVLENVTGTSDVMKRAVNEAKVFRAMAYFELVNLWGPAPLVDHCLNDSEYMVSNSTVADLWAFIEKDLTEAIQSGALTSKSKQSDLSSYRVTKEYAEALLGKAYLFQKKYSQAANMLETVIATNLYDLVPDLSTYGLPEGGNTIESVLEIHSIFDLSNTTPNSNWRWVCIGLRGEKYHYDNNFFCSATWGFQNPTKELYDTYVKIEGENGYRLHNNILTAQQLKDEYGVYCTLPITDNAGYYDMRYYVRTSDWGSYFVANNTRIMRYTEVLLLAAEAQLNNNNAKRATELINQIRRRAKAPEITGDVTMDQIKDESRCELAFEGQRYENIIRWGDAPTLLAKRGIEGPVLNYDAATGKFNVTYSQYNSASECGFKTGKNELLPFPADEISVNKNITQNPGW